MTWTPYFHRYNKSLSVVSFLSFGVSLFTYSQLGDLKMTKIKKT